MQPHAPQKRETLVESKKLTCFGNVCQGRFRYPPYYFGPSGHCVECEAAAAVAKARRRDRDRIEQDPERHRQRRSARMLGELLERIEAAGLSFDETRALGYWYFDGFRADEIADLPCVQCSVRTVEQRLQRAREKLEAAGLPAPQRPRTPRTEKWAPEMIALLHLTRGGRYRTRHPGKPRKRLSDRGD